ncbi:MAG: DUF1080 domain-containing protein [Bacteroidetes bacterium]|nr:DUF1080 domain-containing protein [Bacteroidota bacterium]
MPFHNTIIRLSSAFALICSIQSCKTSSANKSAQEPATAGKNGYTAIFDGKTLDGWEGDSTYWRVEDGCMVGEVAPDTLLKRNSFIIWRGAVTDDFELTVDFKVTPGGNSGINYRSEELKDVPHALKGYQADIGGTNHKYTGQNYEERGRTFLSHRGEQTVIGTDGKPVVTKILSDSVSIQQVIHQTDWNTYHLVVQGNHMQHYVNGVLISDVTDNDAANRKMTGLLGVQVHVGPPMKIYYRNFLLKKL